MKPCGNVIITEISALGQICLMLRIRGRVVKYTVLLNTNIAVRGVPMCSRILNNLLSKVSMVLKQKNYAMKLHTLE